VGQETQRPRGRLTSRAVFARAVLLGDEEVLVHTQFSLIMAKLAASLYFSPSLLALVCC
jgi:hypothetical protein